MNALSKIVLQNLGAPYLARSLRQMWETAISPLRFAPVEMTKLGVIANQAFLNPITNQVRSPNKLLSNLAR